MIKFIEHRIGDPNIKRLLTRMLKAGVMENGEIEATDAGTPQGSIVSPVLANIYLHYVLDLWFDKVISKQCKGQTAIVRYMDDFICCFQYREEAEKFYEALKERLAKFQLELAEDKTKIIEFGRFAASNREERNLGKPETFDFLGFTHYCSTSKQGKFRVKRKTSKKKFRAKLKAINHWAKAVRNAMTTEEIFERVKAILLGYYRYYGVTDNYPMLQRFRYEIVKILYKWLNRRSQRRSFTIDKFKRYLKLNPLPNPKIYVNIMDL